MGRPALGSFLGGVHCIINTATSKLLLADGQSNRGFYVIEVNPVFTSQTCPKCGYCDPRNRDQYNREAFACLNCTFQGNADLDVATHNIAMVAISGRALKRPKPNASGPVTGKPQHPLAAE